MNKLLAIAIASSAIIASSCSMETGGSQEEQLAPEVTGSVMLPLSQTTNGLTFDVDGDLTIRSATTGAVVAEHELNSMETTASFTLAVGNYTVTLSNWSTYMRVSGLSVATNVTPISRLITAETVPFTIVAGQTANVAYDFVIDGQVVIFNSCNSDKLADALKCPTKDSDNDGILNSVECVNAVMTDSDNDGLPNCNDNDSDNDGVVDFIDNVAGGILNPCLPSTNAATCIQPDGSVNIGANVCLGSVDAGACLDAGAAR